MHYSPGELKLSPLKEVSAGSIAALVGRKDISFVLRLNDTGQRPRVMILGGEYSFHTAEWSDIDALAKVVCAAKDLRIRLNEVDERASCTDAGILCLYNGGAFITAAPGQHAFHGVQIGLDSWQDVDRSVLRGDLMAYPRWEFGTLDHRGDFVSLFQRK